MSMCEQFAKILHGESEMKNGVCSVSFHRNITVFVQGRPSMSVVPVGISFEALDHNGNALNLGEIAILEEEIPSFLDAIVKQGIIVSALHNHWIYMKPNILYLHIQSVEQPLNFAHKIANAFKRLSSYPIPIKD